MTHPPHAISGSPALAAACPLAAGRTKGQAGFALIEVLLASAILVLALLGHAASVAAEHTLAKSLNDRGLAIQTLQKVIERVRADPDWSGLYATLRAKSTESSGDTGLSWLKEDTSLTTYALTSYYSDLVAPTSLGTVTVLIQVPSTTVSGVAALRENATAPRYGLPHDLNGDGTIDGNSRDSDYRSVPIVARLRWKRGAQNAQEVVLTTWITGER
jgi:prepilin-type N-terminal cleavage/methylation domain-containing protein